MSRPATEMSRRLLITDRYDAPALRNVVNGRYPGVAWDVLLLGLSNSWFRWQHSPPTSHQDMWRLVDPAPHAAEASNRVGDFLVDLVERLPRTDLGGQTLDGLLKTPEGSLWWFLEISEKGPFRGPLVTQLYRLALARAAIQDGRYDEVHVSLADQLLADVFQRADSASPHITVLPTRRTPGTWLDRRPRVAYWTHSLGAVARVGAIKALLYVFPASVGTPAGQGLAAFTFYPAWWTRPFSQDATDRFFSHLGEAGVSRYLAWLTGVRSLWRHRRQVAQVLPARRVEPLQAHVRIRDLLAVLSFRRYTRMCRIHRRARVLLHEKFEAFEVGAVIAAELSRSITSSEVALDKLIACAVRRCVTRAAPRGVLYRLEFQPFENALLRGLRGRSRGIGFLHYPFGRHYLSSRFAPGEVPRYLSGADRIRDRPLPDGVIACGPVGIDHIADSGYPRSQCAVCGPQRFGRLVEYRRTCGSREDTRVRLRLPIGRSICLVTLAIIEEDTAALFAALAGGVDSALGCQLVIRTHPNRPAGDPALKAALKRFGQSRASLMDSSDDIYDHIVAADAIVCIGSMIAFEAMALDRMPIVFENPSTFPALSLAEFEDGLFVVHDEAGLRAALDAISRDTDEVQAKRRCWPTILSRVLGDLQSPVPEQLARALSQLDATPYVGGTTHLSEATVS
jgi:hypothetical protein